MEREAFSNVKEGKEGLKEQIPSYRKEERKDEGKKGVTGGEMGKWKTLDDDFGSTGTFGRGDDRKTGKENPYDMRSTVKR